nr:SIR2 family protein [uncultured Pedobacter sp.]
MELTKKIKTAIDTDQLVIFAGSGLSTRFNLPNWSTLVSNIITELDDNKYLPLIQLIEGNVMTPIEVLGKIRSNENDVRRYIKEQFQLKKESSDLTLHKKILNLTGQVITTNYDNAFELASDNRIIPAVYTSKYNISEINKSNQSYIFKLHGSFSEPDNCVIFPEDYQELYKEETASKQKLKSIFTDKLILFIGFSFNDPDINLIFENLNKSFGGNNQHYVLTKEPEKFIDYSFLKALEIADYSKIEPFIDTLLDYKGSSNPKNIHSTINHGISKINLNNSPKIAILTPNPINEVFGKLNDNLIDAFSALDSKLLIGHLNLKTLESLYDFDLIVIVSKVFKKRIYIEDENLMSSLLSGSEILSHIPNDEIPIIFITDEKIPYVDGSKSVLISTFKSATIKKFIFKALREKKLDFVEDDIDVHLSKIFDYQLSKGKSQVSSIYKNHKNLQIGKKILASVVGRIEEQSIIASKLIAIRKSNKLLNIKASGGTGKTTLVKKVSYELYNRGYFSQGVNFKSCENVKTLSNLEDILIEGFNLINILDFKGYLIDNYSNEKLDLLIILDNFESVVNNLEEREFEDAVELLRFVTDYSNIAVTSRERISMKDDLEDIYSLTPLITEDALILFQNEYGEIRNSVELKILREDILEDLLNNNPLAIKLVTRSRTNYSHIYELKEQLQAHFFESINEDYSSVFSSNADLNIQRTKSIFQSINYSYTTLNPKEKIAFELLSLFPDGIGLTNFKNSFSNRTSKNQISDIELRSLKNKSLLEDYNGTLQLQPIIRRFADFQFNKRPSDIKKRYCSDAYAFNCFLLDMLEFVEAKRSTSDALRIFTSLKNNLLEVLNYLESIEISPDSATPKKIYLLNFICGIDDYIANDKQIQEYRKKLIDLRDFFSDIPNGEELLDVLELCKIYYHKEFDNSYKKLKSFLAVEDMLNLKFNEQDYLEIRYKKKIMHIHSMEGFTMDVIKTFMMNNDTSRFLDLHFFYLGVIDNISRSKNGFYRYEYDLMFDRLEINRLEDYINSLYSEEHLEIMQCTYTLSKVKDVNQNSIQKLVVTNPYTKGLKELMMAFICQDSNEKEIHFQKALNNLTHIKYYYLEALFYYSCFLKEKDSPLFGETVNKGLDMCNSCYYQYLSYLFGNLKNSLLGDYVFTYAYYPVAIKEYVDMHNKDWAKFFRQKHDEFN